MEYNVFQNRVPLLAVQQLSEWKVYQFDELLIDDTKSALKVKKEDYLEQGQYLIVDQGQAVVAGYRDDANGLYKTTGSIVFGDHTRAIKYIDFPLFLGADGVKLLKCKLEQSQVNMKYVYYFLKTIELPSDGYSRHFKYLKQVLIPVPPIKQQQQIVAVLDKNQELIEKRREQIKVCDELIKSQFIEMFGDPVINPMKWRVKPLAEMGKCKNGMNFHYDDSGVEINCLGVGDFKDLAIIKDTMNLPKVTLSEMPSDEYLLKDNDIVFVRSNGNKSLVGRSVAVYPQKVPTTFSGFCIRYRNEDDEITIPYLLRVLKTESMRAKMTGRGANIQNLNQQILSTLMIPVPPIKLQNEFAQFVQQVDKLKFEMEQSLTELENNFNSLMQKAFKGELF